MNDGRRKRREKITPFNVIGRDWYGNVIGKSYSAFLNYKSIHLLVCTVIIGIYRSIVSHALGEWSVLHLSG
jgi:hypothetical protein